MAEALRFTCGTCGKVHQGLPDYGFETPDHYLPVPEAERSARCRLSSDLCVIDERDHFVRAVLLVPIRGTAERFGWGVWSSLSADNFRRYEALWDAEDVSREGPWVGWLSNRVPFYPDTLALKVAVQPQNDGRRPLLELEPTDHPLARDQCEGITLARAVELAEALMHPDRSR